MANVTAPSWIGSIAGINVYAYPLSGTYPLSQWLTHRVLLPDQEGSRPITLDNSKGMYWGLFEGNAQPTDKSDAVAIVSLEDNVAPVNTVSIPAILENAGYDPTNIVRFRGTTWKIVIEDLGLLDNISQAWFTLRKRQSDTDASSIVQVALSGGLLFSNGQASGNPGNGSLAVTNSTTGVVTIIVSAAETTNFPVTDNLQYDIKVKRNDGSIDLVHTSDKFSIVREVTRKIT